MLVELLSSLQVVCLTIALIGGAVWVRASVQRIVRHQIMGDNRLIASQMSRLISTRSGISSADYGSASWEELQSLIEDFTLPGDGFMCVANATNGKLLCHPDIRTNPELRESDVLRHTITVDGQESSIRNRLQVGRMGQQFTGLIGGGNATEVVTAASLPRLDSVLLVHQSERGFRKAVNLLLLPIGTIALVVGLSLILVTKKASVGILNLYENRIAQINEGLEETVRVRTRALTRTRDAVIFGLAKLSESRDNDTGEHLERISAYVTILAEYLSAVVPVEQQLIDDIGLASSLHDIGKVGVPDRVLLKPGRLTEEERRVIETHPRIGQECLQALEQQLGEDNFLSLATEICACHHERWDGSGYPSGLAGTAIPLSARIVALADVYDALTSRRPYKKPMTHHEARSIILDGRGTHFDPDVVDAFLAGEQEFEALSEQQLIDRRIPDENCQAQTTMGGIAQDLVLATRT